MAEAIAREIHGRKLRARINLSVTLDADDLVAGAQTQRGGARGRGRDERAVAQQRTLWRP